MRAHKYSHTTAVATNLLSRTQARFVLPTSNRWSNLFSAGTTPSRDMVLMRNDRLRRVSIAAARRGESWRRRAGGQKKSALHGRGLCAPSTMSVSESPSAQSWKDCALAGWWFSCAGLRVGSRRLRVLGGSAVRARRRAGRSLTLPVERLGRRERRFPTGTR